MYSLVLVHFMLITSTATITVDAYVCVISPRYDTAVKRMRWAMPSFERCLCQGVIAKKGATMCPLKEEEYGYDGKFWYTDEPKPLTVRSNWNPVKLNELLEREAICSKFLLKG